MKGTIQLDSLTDIVGKLTPFITDTVVTFSPDYIKTRNLTPDRTVFIEAEAPSHIYHSAEPPAQTVGINLTKLEDALTSLQSHNAETATLEVTGDYLSVSTPSVSYRQRLKEQAPLRPDVDIPSFNHTAQLVVDTAEFEAAVETTSDIAEMVTLAVDPTSCVFAVHAQDDSQSASITIDSPVQLDADSAFQTVYPAGRLASLISSIDTDQVSVSFSEHTMATIRGGFLDGAQLKYVLVPSKQSDSASGPSHTPLSDQQRSPPSSAGLLRSGTQPPNTDPLPEALPSRPVREAHTDTDETPPQDHRQTQLSDSHQPEPQDDDS
jgi:hypothetical protein